MFKTFLNNLKDSIISVLPISIVILIIGPLIKIDLSTLLVFILGAFFLALGLALFQTGAYESTGIIAQDIGSFIVKRRNIIIFVGIAFVVGFLITIAEPALWVLGNQLKEVMPEHILILTIAVGVGIFLIVGLLRIIFGFKLRTLFLILYIFTFLVAIGVNFINPEFIPLAFDSGGVTTGPMAVPFIMGLCYGLVKNIDNAEDSDSFGLVGIASVGPILAVLILGLFVKIDPNLIATGTDPMGMMNYFKQYIWQMAIAISPFILFFVVFQIIDFKFSKKKVIKILVAFVFTYVGLVLFLTGANAGFANVGTMIGQFFGSSNYNWILIIIGAVFGFLIVSAEPSVIALNRQVEEVSAGAVSRRMMMVGLTTGVSIAIALALVRVITGIHVFWILIPGYIVAVLLSFKAPKLFSGIAFDSGGAVSGAMTSAFLMPFAIGASVGVHGNSLHVLTDAFGLVAFVAMSPLITIQVIGLIYERKAKKSQKQVPEFKDEIIDV